MKISKSSIKSEIVSEYYLSNKYLTVKINKNDICGIFGSDNGKYVELISTDQIFDSAVYRPNMLVLNGHTKIEYILSPEKPALAISVQGSKIRMKFKANFQKNFRIPIIEKILCEDEKYEIYEDNKKIKFIGNKKKMSLNFENSEFKMIKKGNYIVLEILPKGKAWIIINLSDELISSKDIESSNLNYINYLENRFNSDDVLLNSLFVFSLHTAFANHKCGIEKNFSALFAGPSYSLPARTYYRDSFWTSKALLPFKPSIVKDQILSLSNGISDDGTAPSGIIFASESELERSREFMKMDPRIAEFQKSPEDWWSDHWDSPYFFILLVSDYIKWTGDFSIFSSKIINAFITILERFANSRWIFQKSEDTRDWSDNVLRSGLVTYDLALYAAALSAASELFKFMKNHTLSARYFNAYKIVRDLINSELWKNDHYIDYFDKKRNKKEEHLNIDTLVTLLYDISNDSEKAIDYFKKSLFTEKNEKQRFGDWGVMSVWPFYKIREDLRSKSAFPYRYHNGSDWPYWDGILAKILLDRNDPEWRYPLLRSWKYSISHGWYLPVEYYSPPFGRGGLLQAWSSTPVWAICSGGFGIDPTLNEELKIKNPPWRRSSLKFNFRGQGREIAF